MKVYPITGKQYLPILSAFDCAMLARLHPEELHATFKAFWEEILMTEESVILKTWEDVPKPYESKGEFIGDCKTISYRIARNAKNVLAQILGEETGKTPEELCERWKALKARNESKERAKRARQALKALKAKRREEKTLKKQIKAQNYD